MGIRIPHMGVRREEITDVPVAVPKISCAALRRPLKILTAATRSSRFLCHRQRSIRSPHRCAHRFAMTILGSAVHVGGGTHGCRPTGDNREYGASGGVEPRPYA